MSIFSMMQQQNRQAVHTLFGQPMTIIDARELSSILREARKAFKATKDPLFLHAGRYIWQQSPLKETEDSYIQNAVGWILYDLYFQQLVDGAERLHVKRELVQYTKHEEYSPLEVAVHKFIDELDNAQGDYREEKLALLNQLQPHRLTNEPFVTTEGRALASRREKWYAQQVKLRFELQQYESCIQAGEEMLQAIQTFHHDNDKWAKRRIALSHLALGDREKAKQLLHQLLVTFDNTNIYADLHRIYAEEQQIDKAISYGANAILNKAGEMVHKLKVLEKMAELYEIEQQPQLAYSHYALLREVREREGWVVSESVLQKIAQFEQASVQKLEQRQLKPYWVSAAQSIYEKGSGKIVRYISKEARKIAGFIEMDNGRQIYFTQRNNRHFRDCLPEQTAVEFYIRPSYDQRQQREKTEAIYVNAR